VRSRENNTISSKQLNQMIMLLMPAIICLLGAVFTFAAPLAFFPAHVYRAMHNISGGNIQARLTVVCRRSSHLYLI
jgi:hypothetical protein